MPGQSSPAAGTPPRFRSLTSADAAWAEPLPGLGLELELINEVATHLDTNSQELLMNAWCALEATMAI